MGAAAHGRGADDDRASGNGHQPVELEDNPPGGDIEVTGGGV